MDRLTKIFITVAIVIGGAGFLIYSSLAKSAAYYKHVEEVMVTPDQWTNKNLQVHGFVEAGSIKEEIVGQNTHRTFVLHSKGARIRVVNQGPKPDTFKDMAEVVAKGKLVVENGEYVLHADELMAKCPSKYEENQRTRDIGRAPR
jgi:cytochrome c-type biogenesis protein CcmE